MSNRLSYPRIEISGSTTFNETMGNISREIRNLLDKANIKYTTSEVDGYGPYGRVSGEVIDLSRENWN